MTYRKTCLAVIFLIAALSSPEAQSFRGNPVPVELPGPGSVETSLGSGDVAVIAVPADSRFITGLDIRIRPATDAVIAPGLFSVVVYAAVDAPATEGTVTIAGNRKARFPITSASSLPVVVSFSGAERQVVPAGTQLITDVDPKIGAIGVQIVPTAKGMSQELLDTVFSLRLAPVLRPKGGLIVHLGGDEDAIPQAVEVLEIKVDGRTVKPEVIQEFDPGIYRLTAHAGDYLSYTANVGIERGRVREETLIIRRPRATVRINVPSVAEVFWNGELISPSEISVESGEHTLLIRLGDFSLSKKVYLEPNGDYQLGVDLDILLKQN